MSRRSAAPWPAACRWRYRWGPEPACHRRETGKTQRCLNLGSYNYLGFGVGGCDQGVLDAMEQHSISTSSSRIEQGTTKLHQQLEDECVPARPHCLCLACTRVPPTRALRCQGLLTRRS